MHPNQLKAFRRLRRQRRHNPFRFAIAMRHGGLSPYPWDWSIVRESLPRLETQLWWRQPLSTKQLRRRPRLS